MALGILTPEQAQARFLEGTAAFLQASTTQARDALEEEPVSLFLSCLHELALTGQARIANTTDTCGGDFTLLVAFGLVDREFLYLLLGQAYGAFSEHLRKQGVRAFPIGPRILGKRMSKRGMIVLDPRGNPTRNRRMGGKFCRVW